MGRTLSFNDNFRFYTVDTKIGGNCMKKTIKVNYYSYRTNKLIRSCVHENTTYNKVMVGLYSINHKYIAGNSTDSIDVYI